MAYAVVQHTANSGSTTLAFGSNLTAGNTALVGVIYDPGSTISGVSGSHNGAYTQAGSTFNSSNVGAKISIYRFFNVSAGAETITVSGLTAANTFDIFVVEVSGLGATPILDTSTSGQGTSSPASLTIVPTSSDFIFVAFGSGSGTSGTLTNLTLLDNVNDFDYFDTTNSAGSVTCTDAGLSIWGGTAVAFNPGQISESISGTISVSGVVTATLSGLSESVSGNVSISGTSNIQFAYDPSLSGLVSISGVVTPTLGNVNLSISGAVDVTGLISPSLGLATGGSVNVSGSVNPTFSGGGTQPVTISGTLQISGSISITLSGPPPTPPPPAGKPPLFIGQQGRFDVIANAIIRRDPTTIVQESSTGNYYFLKDILDPLLVSTQDPTYNPGLRFANMEWLQDQGTISWVTPTGSRQLLYTIITTMQWQNGNWVPK
jgi:hypothetical protein